MLQSFASEKRECSCIDARGYCAAEAPGIGFLTCDLAFKGLDGVEFER